MTRLPTHKIRRQPLKLATGLILRLCQKSLRQPTAADLQQADFKTSTQRLGVCLNERIRQVFRHKWLRKI